MGNPGIWAQQCRGLDRPSGLEEMPRPFTFRNSISDGRKQVTDENRRQTGRSPSNHEYVSIVLSVTCFLEHRSSNAWAMLQALATQLRLLISSVNGKGHATARAAS